MKSIKQSLLSAIGAFTLFTLICGVLYTGTITLAAQIFFPNQANGSMIEVEGVQYGSSLLAQSYQDEKHLWGRIMNLDVSTYKDKNGNPLLYSAPSNLSPTSSEYQKLIAERVAMIEEAHPEMAQTPIPLDLVTNSGSGLDPHISMAAAKYQVKRIANANKMKEEEILQIIEECSNRKFLGIFGEETVNVLKVNLMLENIL